MGALEEFFHFMADQSGQIADQTIRHLGITSLSLLLSIATALPLSIWITEKPKAAKAVLGIASILQTIPSIALLGFLIPWLGIGLKPAIFSLFLYALLPIIRNSYSGIKQIDSNILEAAEAFGMSNGQILLRIKLPLAFPFIMAGIRTAAVINIGVATLAAYIAAGGLGEFIFTGIALNNTHMILAGALPAAILALLTDYVLALCQSIKPGAINKKWLVLPLSILFLLMLYLLPAMRPTSLIAGFPPEFMGRQDGNAGLKDKYGLQLYTLVVNDALMYQAAALKQVDVIAGYSTDGRVRANDLIILDDDEKLFPPYKAAPVIRESFLKEHPDLAVVFDMLTGKISDSLMTELNYQVDHLKQAPQQVAQSFLLESKLLPNKAPGSASQKKGDVHIGCKIFDEQYILAYIYAGLIDAYTDLKPVLHLGLGGTKLCFDALVNKQIDFYVEYSGTAMNVLLELPQNAIASMLQRNDQGEHQLDSMLSSQYGLKWLPAIGFNNSYALMMRRKQSDELGVKSISDLAIYIHEEKEP